MLSRLYYAKTQNGLKCYVAAENFDSAVKVVASIKEDDVSMIINDIAFISNVIIDDNLLKKN